MSALKIKKGATSHSAYNLRPNFSDVIERHTLAVLVENEPGVLARVIGLFSGRGYNIDSLTVAEVDHTGHLSRITIVTSGTRKDRCLCRSDAAFGLDRSRTDRCGCSFSGRLRRIGQRLFLGPLVFSGGPYKADHR